VPCRRALVRETAEAIRCGVALRRGASALRGPGALRFGGDPRLCLRSRHRRPAGLVDLRRQADDTSPPRRACAGAADAVSAGGRPGLDGAVAAARRRGSAIRRCRGARRGSSRAITRRSTEPTAERLAQSYGSDSRQILGAPSGQDFGHGLCEAELRWLVDKEWACTAADVLWRRTKLGLVMDPAEAQQIAAFLARVKPPAAPPAAAAGAPAGQTAYR